MLRVVLITDVAHDFLDNILHRYQSGGATELVDDDGNVHLVGAELFEEVFDLLCFRNEVGGADQFLPVEVLRIADVEQQVLGVQNAGDVVVRLFIDGDAREAATDNEVEGLLKRAMGADRFHVHAGDHDLVGGLVVKLPDLLEHFVLIGRLFGEDRGGFAGCHLVAMHGVRRGDG